METEGLLIYKSSYGTQHEKILELNNNVAGTIIPEEIDLATLRGIQFEGVLIKESIAFYFFHYIYLERDEFDMKTKIENKKTSELNQRF